MNAIKTNSGRDFVFLDPENHDYQINDIAHGLSHLCRFNGHTRQFYCPTPDQRVLTADLRWVPAGDLAVVQHPPMAFDRVEGCVAWQNLQLQPQQQRYCLDAGCVGWGDTRHSPVKAA